MNTFYFLRHGETTKEPGRPATEWQLTPATELELTKLAADPLYSKITKIYTSHEDKAIRTALPFSEKLKITPVIRTGLEEVHRGNKFLTDEDFKKLKRLKLEDLDSNPDSGESSRTALTRFLQTINLINESHQNEHLLIVSHGTVLALYFAYLKNDYASLYLYWSKIPFCGVGVTYNNSVIKDFLE